MVLHMKESREWREREAKGWMGGREGGGRGGGGGGDGGIGVRNAILYRTREVTPSSSHPHPRISLRLSIRLFG